MFSQARHPAWPPLATTPILPDAAKCAHPNLAHRVFGFCVLRPQRCGIWSRSGGQEQASVEETEKRGGGSGATRAGAVPSWGGPPSERTFLSRVKRRFRAGRTSDRPWAESFATDSTAASGILPKELASSADGRSEIFPPMNRRNPTPGRRARGYGSRCGARGSDSPLNRLLSSPWAVRENRMNPKSLSSTVHGLVLWPAIRRFPGDFLDLPPSSKLSSWWLASG